MNSMISFENPEYENLDRAGDPISPFPPSAGNRNQEIYYLFDSPLY